MKDFFKIFLILCALLGAFLLGRNHGEKTFLHSERFKEISLLKSELEFSKSELENAKTKLQNLLDRADQKKQEELLAQILQVFLVDLGLRLQDKKIAETGINKVAAAAPASPLEATQTPKKENEQPAPIKPGNTKWSGADRLDYEFNERRLIEARSEQQVLRLLNKLKITNLDNYFKQSASAAAPDFAELQGLYKGKVLDFNRQRFGTLSFRYQIKEARIRGEISFSSEKHGSGSRSFDEEYLGQKVQGLYGMVIEQSRNKYFHFYKLEKQNKIVGNYYEKLPNGTTKLIGPFVLNRVDQF